MGLPQPGPEAADVRWVMDGDARPEELSRMLLQMHLHAIAKDDPESAEVATALALPRFFDAEIVGVLRGSAEPERDAGLIEQLARFSLVLDRRDGTLAYHDSLRHELLLEWQREAAEEAAELNRRLVEHYESRIARAERLQSDLAEVGPLIASARPERYGPLLAEVRARALTSMREALYHSLAISTEAGCAFLGAQCERLEAAGRVSLCTELTRAARVDVMHLPAPSSTDAFVRQVAYWEARVAVSRGDFEEALRGVAEVEQHTHDAHDRLQLWTLLLRIQAHRALGDRNEARAAVESAVALIEEHDPDPHNAPLVFDQLARLHLVWLEFDEARVAHKKALERARAAGNGLLAIGAHLGLVTIAQREGERAEAVTQALTALDLAQSDGVRDATEQHRLLSGLLGVIALESPWHLPTLRAELAVLRRDPDDVEGEPARECDVGLEVAYAYAADDAGLFTEAGAAVDRLEAFAGSQAMSAGALLELSLVASSVRAHQGRYAEAAQAHAWAPPGCSRWDQAALLTNRALAELYVTPAAAEDSLRRAIAEWEAIGHASYLALARALLVRALCRLGRADEAEEVLAAIAADEEPSAEVHGDIFEARAALARARGDWSEAAAAEAQAGELYRRRHVPREHARALGREGEALAMAMRWPDAAARLEQAALTWRDAHALDVSPTARPDAMREGDEHDAAGVRALVRGGCENGDLHTARAAFTRALEKCPDDPWYNLNRAYTCARLGDWTEAESAISTAIDAGAPWDHPVLLDRREQFALERELAGQEQARYAKPGGALTRWVRGVLNRED